MHSLLVGCFKRRFINLFNPNTNSFYYFNSIIKLLLTFQKLAAISCGCPFHPGSRASCPSFLWILDLTSCLYPLGPRLGWKAESLVIDRPQAAMVMSLICPWPLFFQFIAFRLTLLASSLSARFLVQF